MLWINSSPLFIRRDKVLVESVFQSNVVRLERLALLLMILPLVPQVVLLHLANVLPTILATFAPASREL
jgi:hypothetical protein